MNSKELKNDNYSISVIIPNFNRKEPLIRAIKSVLSQTYSVKEIIIVDDNSEYDAKKFLQENFFLEYENGFIKLFVNEQNYGCAKSRNVGIKRSNSNFIALLDSDDVWQSTKLEKQINKFKKNQLLDLVYCDQFIIENDKKVNWGKMINNNILDHLIDFWAPPSPSTLLFKKKSLEKIGNFNEEIGRSGSDHYLWFRLAIEKLNIDFVNEPLCDYIIDGVDRTSYNLKNRIASIKVLLSKIKDYIPKEKNFFFRNKYICNVSLYILTNELKQKNFSKVSFIYLRYLMFNIFFYKRLFEKTKKLFNN